MSITHFPGGNGAAPLGNAITKVTLPALAGMKREGKPISALTAYDYATSRLVDEAGIDMILVGDSLAMVVLGYENTLAVTVDEMLHHTRAVRRAVHRALVVADMPFGSSARAARGALASVGGWWLVVGGWVGGWWSSMVGGWVGGWVSGWWWVVVGELVVA